MASSSGFEPVLSAQATAFLLAQAKRKQRRLVDLLYRLCAHPTQVGDYSLRDDAGREVQFLMVGDLIIGFWADQAVRELRITEIVEV